MTAQARVQQRLPGRGAGSPQPSPSFCPRERGLYSLMGDLLASAPRVMATPTKLMAWQPVEEPRKVPLPGSSQDSPDPEGPL